MQIDTTWLRKQFVQFNRQYFDSKLPTPRFYVGYSRTQLGSLSWKQGTLWNNSPYRCYTIRMSNYYDQSEHSFQSVLLHEMIHLAIAHSGIKDTSPHGDVFRKMMERFNNDGWDIHVMTRIENMDRSNLKPRNTYQLYLVLALQMDNGQRFLSSVNPRYAIKLNKEIPSIHEITHFSWYMSSDAWFASIPRVRSLRGIPVDSEFYNEKLRTMTPTEIPDLPPGTYYE